MQHPGRNFPPGIFTEIEMNRFETEMLMAHGVPETAIIDAIVWGQMQGALNRAHRQINMIDPFNLPQTGFANRSLARTDGPKVVKAKATVAY